MARPSGPTPEAQYDEFVKSTLQHLQRGLELDGTTKKQKIGEVLRDRLASNAPISAAQRAIEGRFALGGDDAAYLQSGLATLWTTATTDGAGGRAEALAPPGLYAPDAIDGIRQGLVRGLRAKSEAMQKDAPALLNQLVAPLTALLRIPTVAAHVAVAMGAQSITDVITNISIDWTDPNAAPPMLAYVGKLLTEVQAYLTTNNDPANPVGGSLAQGILDAINQQQQAIQDQLLEIQGLTRDVAECTAEKARLRANCDAEKAALEAAHQQEVGNYEARVNTLSGDLQDVRDARSTCEAELAAARAERDNAQAARETAQAELQAASAELINQERILNAELARKESERVAVASQLSDTTAALQTLRDRLKNCEERLRAAEAEGQSMSQEDVEELERLRAEEAASKVGFAAMTESVRIAQEERDRVVENLRVLQEAVAAFRARAPEVNALQKQVEELNRAVAEKEKDLKRAVKTQSEAAAQLIAVSAELADYKERFETKSKAYDGVVGESERQKRTLQRTSEELRAKQQEVASLTKSLDKTRSTNVGLKRGLESAKADVVRLNATLKKAREDWNATLQDQRKRLQELDNLLYVESDALGEKWRTTMADWIKYVGADAEDEAARLATARKIAGDLGTLSMRRILNEHIRDYALVEVYATRDAIADSELEQPINDVDAGVCATLGGLLKKNAEFQSGAYEQAMEALCKTLRSWGLYKRSDSDSLRDNGKPLILHMPLCAEEDNPGVFVPLTPAALAFAEQNPGNVAAMSRVLNYLFNLPNEGDQARAWKLERLEDQRFPHLFLDLKGTKLEDAYTTEQSVILRAVTAVGSAVSGAVGGAVNQFRSWWGGNAGAVKPKPAADTAAASAAARAEPRTAARLGAAARATSSTAKARTKRTRAALAARDLTLLGGAALAGRAVVVDQARASSQGAPPAPPVPGTTPLERPSVSERPSIAEHSLHALTTVVLGVGAKEAAIEARLAPSLLSRVALDYRLSSMPLALRADPAALALAAQDGDAKATQILQFCPVEPNGTVNVVAFPRNTWDTTAVAMLMTLASDGGNVELAVDRGIYTVTSQSFRTISHVRQTGDSLFPPGRVRFATGQFPLALRASTARYSQPLLFDAMVEQRQTHVEAGDAWRDAPTSQARLLATDGRGQPQALPAPTPPSPSPEPPSPTGLQVAANATVVDITQEVIEQCNPSDGPRRPPGVVQTWELEDVNGAAMRGTASLGRLVVPSMTDSVSGFMVEEEPPQPVIVSDTTLGLTGPMIEEIGDVQGAPSSNSSSSAIVSRRGRLKPPTEAQQRFRALQIQLAVRKAAQRRAREAEEAEKKAAMAGQLQPRARSVPQASREDYTYVTSMASKLVAFAGWTYGGVAGWASSLRADPGGDPGGDPEPSAAGYEDALAIQTAVVRGLVGQRGPTEAASDACPCDKELPYAMPSITDLARCMPALRQLLATTPDPTDDEVQRAQSRFAPKQRRTSAATDLAALHALEGNFAITGAAAAKADDERSGVEVPHGVRWMPTGARAGTMARTAVLEHAIARCKQVASDKSTSAEIRDALRGAAAALKLQQLEGLYSLHEALEYDDDPHPIGTAIPLVTRPCAIVRGVLSFPVDHGVAPAPLGYDADDETPMTDTVKLGAAMDKTLVATAQLRNALRRREVTGANLYVAPPASELTFRPAPEASAAPTGVALGLYASDRVRAGDFSITVWLRVVNRALVHLDALNPNSARVIGGFLEAAAVGDVSGALVSAAERREGLWSEFRRNVAISQDRLWVFVRLMSGCVGGDVNDVITMADEATLKATKAIQDQRVAIAKRVSDMQAKIVETIVGSIARESKLTMDKNGDDEFVVIDGAARQQLNDLASGESGRPFFEANVAVRNLQDPNNPSNRKTKLSHLLHSLANVGNQLQESLETTLTQPGAASASLTELSHPANCYFVSMRTDASAAIRVAHERLNVELGVRGAGRRISLWELVEGGCTTLTTRFAEFAGYVLVQARSSTGVSALYISQQAIQTNAYQARIGLDKLVRIATIYAQSVSGPEFVRPDSMAARSEAMNAGAGVQDVAIGHLLGNPRLTDGSVKLVPSVHVHPSGWGVVGARRF